MNYSYSNPGKSEMKKGYIKVTGVGAVKAIPDTAIANLGIITENTVLEGARRENSVRTAAVINVLTSMGIEKKNISTGAFSIDPMYDYVDGKQVFRGYRVTNLLTVTIEDIARAGEVIDKATFSGVNRVDNISFVLSDQREYYDKALALAVQNALHKGEVIGNELNVEVDEVPYKVVEKSDGAVLYEASVTKLSAPTTPVMPGQIEITSTVMVVLGYK